MRSSFATLASLDDDESSWATARTRKAARTTGQRHHEQQKLEAVRQQAAAAPLKRPEPPIQNGAYRVVHGTGPSDLGSAALAASKRDAWYGARAPDYYREFIRCFKEASTGDVVLRFHRTDIVKLKPSGDVLLTTGGYFTHTTLASMNDALQFVGMEVRSGPDVKDGTKWEVRMGAMRTPYKDMLLLKARSPDDADRGAEVLNGMRALLEPWTGGKNVSGVNRGPGPGLGRPSAAHGDGGERTPAVRPAPPPAPSPIMAAAADVTSAPDSAARAWPELSGASRGAGTASGCAWAARGTLAARLASEAVAAPAAPAAGVTAPQTPSVSSFGSRAASPTSTPATRPPPAAAPAAGLTGGGGDGVGGCQAVNQATAALLAQAALLPLAVDDATLCVVCMHHVSDTILIPCSHTILCRGCADMIMNAPSGVQGECPMCRTSIDLVLEVN